MSLAVKTSGLGKRYFISHAHDARYGTLRESLMNGLRDTGSKVMRALGQHRQDGRTETEEFWALKDLNFEISAGERVGIIGHNGAGKSTLLKILSRITEPTLGRIEIDGRAASLLEVGTGFHPELTGRENIFLNGAILGMSKAEIRAKFDAIVDFAEVEQFLDTPVKRYSSGMYVRLAFAVAAFLEPDILIVDEVLAVGDARFQKKSLEKMGEARKSGRTVLFVSHNMPAMQRLCTRAILLKGGRIIEDGDTSDVVMSYLSQSSGEQNQAPHREARAAGQKSEEIALRSWSIQSAGQGPHMLASGQDLAIDLQLDFRRSLEDCAFGLAIWTDEGILAWSGTTNDLTGFQGDFPKGNHTVTIRIRKFSLKPGRYRIETSVDSRGLRLDRWHLVPELTILPNRATSLVPEWQGLTTFDFSVNSQPSHVPDHAMRPMVATDAGGDPAPYS